MELCVYMGNRKIILKTRLLKKKKKKDWLIFSCGHYLPNHYHLLLEEVEDGGVVEFTKKKNRQWFY